MKKEKAIKRDINNEGKYKFWFRFALNERYNATNGFPLSGYLRADTLDEAIAKVKKIAEETRTRVWENSHGIAFQALFGENIHLSQSLSVVDMCVKLDYLVDDWGDAHDARLRDIINLIWAMPQYDKSFKQIMSVYWERDKEELANYFSEECYWWKASEKSFDDICDDDMYNEMCDQMFSHIFDDADYKAIISYIRPHDIEGWVELI